MIQTIQQFIKTDPTSQRPAQAQTGDVRQQESFRNALRAAGKATAKPDTVSQKAEEISDSGEKTEQDKEQADAITAFAAAQNVAAASIAASNAQAQQDSGTPPVENGTAQAATPAASAAPTGSDEAQPISAQAEQIPVQTAAQTVPAQSTDPGKTQALRPQQPEIAAQEAQQNTGSAVQSDERQTNLTETPTAIDSTPPTNAEMTEAIPTKEAPDAHQPQPDSEEIAFSEAKTEEMQQKKTTQTDTGAVQTAGSFSALSSSDGTVIVKVSDAPAEVEAPVSSQIAGAAADGLKEGKQQIQIDLYPESLGKVSVKMSSESGVLTIEIAASDPKTQSLIASSSNEIRSLLQTSTGRPVEVAQQQQNGQQYAQQQNENSAQEEAARQQQQQQQEETQRQYQAAWYAAGNSSGFSTGDFLTALRQAAV